MVHARDGPVTLTHTKGLTSDSWPFIERPSGAERTKSACDRGRPDFDINECNNAVTEKFQDLGKCVTKAECLELKDV